MKVTFFRGNRTKLINHYDGVAVFAAYDLLQRSNDAAHPFVQEANFWYLTGIEYPGWKLIIENDKSWLVAPFVDAVHEMFDGSLSAVDAKKISGVDAVLSKVEGDTLIESLAKKHKKVISLGKDPHAVHYDFSTNPGPVTIYKKMKKQFSEVIDCRLTLARLRAIKQPEEIEAIRAAVVLTVDAFTEAKKQLPHMQHEYQVESMFSHAFRSRGATGHAYDPIVAGGKNACTLHYGKNGDPLKKAELLLLDIGAQLNGYPADITRTYQIGMATDRQQSVHAAVETAHRAIISLLAPGLSVETYHQQVDVIMKQALDSLGLLKTDSDYRKYFPHAISHGLGIDVHDSLGRPTEFLEGMVLTVEPGIYIPEEGIGVRIEDDILITKTGHENLSAALPTSL